MDRRYEFVLRALSPGANMAALCKEYGISRPTGYKWRDRYREEGFRGLEDRRRGPGRGRSPLRASAEVAISILRLRRMYPTWGSRKLHAVLQRELPADQVPSRRTVERVLQEAGLLTPRRVRRRRTHAPGEAPDVEFLEPNDLWTVDFKGWWRTGDGRRAEPLTVRDAYSRFLLCVELVDAPSLQAVRPVFESLFIDYGLPRALQTDNGSPFATTRSLAGLTQLSAWWLSLGIRFIRGRVGCPQDNGGHERMHRDMKAELQRHPAWDRRLQQDHCDRWRHEFNVVRPHQALGMKTPASVYQRSPRLLPTTPPTPAYPDDYLVRLVTSQGSVRYMGFQRSLSKALGGHHVGFQPLPHKRFRVWFYDLCLGEGRLPWRSPITTLESNSTSDQLELDPSTK